MKKLVLGFITVLCMIFLAGCSLDYHDVERDGNLEYGVGKKKAFVSTYYWDGEEDSMRVVIPREYDGKKIVGIGGYLGRGYPMTFRITIDSINDILDKDAQMVNENDVEHIDKTVELNFLILYRGKLEEGIEAYEDYSEFYDLNGEITEYKFNVDIRKKTDAENGITTGIVIHDETGDEAGNKADVEPDKDDVNQDEGNQSETTAGLFAGADSKDLNLFYSFHNTLIFLNEDGSLYKKINLEDIVPDLFGSWLSISYKGAYDHSLFFTSSRSDDQAVFEYNIDTEELNRIYRGIVVNPKVYINNGEIYMDDQVTNTADSSKTNMTTHIYKDQSGKWTSEDMYEYLNDYSAKNKFEFAYNYNYQQPSLALGATLPRFNKAICLKDSFMYVYDQDGTQLNTVVAEQGFEFSPLAMDSEHVIYTLRDSNYRESGLYSYDLTNDEETCLYQEKNDDEQITVLACTEGHVYAEIQSCPKYLAYKWDVYDFDLAAKSQNLIFSSESIPGRHDSDFSIHGAFKVLGNTILYADSTQSATEILCTYKDGESWAKKNLGITLKEYKYTEYATVEALSCSGVCPYCGKKAMDFYYEYPKFMDSIPGADNINRTTYDKAEELYREASNYEPSYTEDECRDFYHGNEWMTTDCSENQIIGINKLFDKYITINRSVYEMYTGAAHGMYGTYCEFFDINSGDEVGFKDIYQGSEEEFKRAVAEAAKEKFLTDSDFAECVFAMDADEIYDEVYKSVNLDWNAFTFNEDYVSVEFDPYYIGPYAAGSLTVEVSYEALGL